MLTADPWSGGVGGVLLCEYWGFRGWKILKDAIVGRCFVSRAISGLFCLDDPSVLESQISTLNIQQEEKKRKDY